MDFWPVLGGYVLGAIVLVLILKVTFWAFDQYDRWPKK